MLSTHSDSLKMLGIVFLWPHIYLSIHYYLYNTYSRFLLLAQVTLLCVYMHICVYIYSFSVFFLYTPVAKFTVVYLCNDNELILS